MKIILSLHSDLLPFLSTLSPPSLRKASIFIQRNIFTPNDKILFSTHRPLPNSKTSKALIEHSAYITGVTVNHIVNQRQRAEAVHILRAI